MEEGELVDNILSMFGSKIHSEFLATPVERVVLNALRKRLRRLIFCASGEPLCIVFGRSRSTSSCIGSASCSLRGESNPTTIPPTARPSFPTGIQGLGKGVGRTLGVGPALGVGVGLGVAVAVGVDVAVGVAVAVELGVAVAVAVAVGVLVGLEVGVGEAVGVGVGVEPPDGDTRT